MTVIALTGRDGGLAVERAESRAVAEIKGREIWLEVVRRHVDSLLPSDGGLSLRFEWGMPGRRRGRPFTV